MNAAALLFALLIVTSGSVRGDDALHTPEHGSKERQAICDAARAHVMRDCVAPEKLPQPLAFKIQKMEVLGDYGIFRAVPVLNDGSPVGTADIMDIVFELCVKKSDHTWKVIYDLSSTDVPDDAQLKRMWSEFPKDFPAALIPAFWRDHFKRIQ